MKKDNWFERLEKHHEEVGRSKRYKAAIAIGAAVVGLIMLAIVIAGLFLD